jgi:hypothetical protein
MSDKPKKDEAKKDEKKDAPFWDFDPLQGFADVILGTAFDGPKKEVEKITKAGEGNTNGEAKPVSAERHTTNVNVSLDGLFRPINGKPKPKPGGKPGSDASSGTETPKGPPAGDEEQDDE